MYSNIPVYDVGIHEEIIKKSKEGYFLEEIIAEIADKLRDRDSKFKLSKCKFNRWCRDDPELNETLKLCEIYRHAWVLRQGRINLDNPRFNGDVWWRIVTNMIQGFGNKPSERIMDFSKWTGSINDRIDFADKEFREGHIVLEQYEHIMKSLKYHAEIIEITYINPLMQRLDLDSKVQTGEINQEEYDRQIEILETARKAREIVAENIAKETKVLSKFGDKRQRRTKKALSRDQMKTALRSLTDEEIDKQLEDVAVKMHKKLCIKRKEK